MSSIGTEDDLCCIACGAPLSGRAGFAAIDRLHGTPGQFAVLVCSSCGSGTTAPPVRPSELASYYPVGYGPHDDPRHPAARIASWAIRKWQVKRALTSFPLRALGSARTGRGIDVGCGRGDIAAGLIARGWSMTGIEPSPGAAENARARGVEVHIGTLSDVQLQPANFDAAVLRHSLEHTYDPLADLERLSAALVPGGLLAITVPNFGCWQARRFRSRWYHLDVPRHRAHFTKTGLERLLRHAGFAVVECSTSTSSVGLPATIQYAIAARCLFPDGLRLRIASGLCVAALPVARVLDSRAGAGDQLHVLASSQA